MVSRIKGGFKFSTSRSEVRPVDFVKSNESADFHGDSCSLSEKKKGEERNETARPNFLAIQSDLLQARYHVAE